MPSSDIHLQSHELLFGGTNKVALFIGLFRVGYEDSAEDEVRSATDWQTDVLEVMLVFCRVFRPWQCSF